MQGHVVFIDHWDCTNHSVADKPWYGEGQNVYALSLIFAEWRGSGWGRTGTQARAINYSLQCNVCVLLSSLWQGEGGVGGAGRGNQARYLLYCNVYVCWAVFGRVNGGGWVGGWVGQGKQTSCTQLSKHWNRITSERTVEGFQPVINSADYALLSTHV